MSLVTAKCPKANGREVSVNYNFGENLEEATALHGESAVYDSYVQKAVISIQAVIRRMAEAGKTDAEIQTEVDGYKLGVRQSPVGGGVGKGKANSLLAEILSASSDEERQAKIAEAREFLKAKAAKS